MFPQYRSCRVANKARDILKPYSFHSPAVYKLKQGGYLIQKNCSSDMRAFREVRSEAYEQEVYHPLLRPHCFENLHLERSLCSVDRQLVSHRPQNDTGTCLV